jgi:hypothetical protein
MSNPTDYAALYTAESAARAMEVGNVKEIYDRQAAMVAAASLPRPEGKISDADIKANHESGTGYSNRNCNKCGGVYLWDGNIYKTNCRECYLQLSRQCASKGCTNRLPPGSDSWKLVCVQCYKDKKASKMSTCPYCPPERSHLLVRPFDKVMCPKCAEGRAQSMNIK